MARFNTRRTAAAAVRSPVRTTGERAATYEGASGYVRDARSELFLLAVGNYVGLATFYEQGDARDERYTALVRELAVTDPAWTAALLGWLRQEAHMRTASLVGAAEYVHARLAAGADAAAAEGSAAHRAVVASVLQRADEPGELLAYWTSRYGRPVPQPVKRGVADAVRRLWTERALLRYDADGAAFRFGDVLELTHPRPAAPWQGDLFRYALDRRHGRSTEIPETLRTVRARAELLAEPVARRRELVASGTEEARERLAAAAMSWEALAGWLQGPMDAAAWEAAIPGMGVFALVRNLRNFDEAGVGDAAAEEVARRLSDPAEVARSRMLPYRFWAAYKHTASLRWAAALERALNLSLANVPALRGRSLILVDRSPSMFPGYPFSTANRSDIPLAEQAAVFGAALAVRAQAPTLVEFGIASRELPVPRGGSVLRLVESFGRHDGTDIPSAVKQHFDGHDRIVVVTDEQTRKGWLPSNGASHGGMPPTEIDALVPADVPVYMWNMAGYAPGATPSGGGRRHSFGGLTDQAYGMIALLESGRDAHWPWA
ncbi:TROVE domain-containing protein [Streptomyces sp. NRRL F-5123]|uniref:TROVE domain-containing protein n=1 Tax=Streptomyces sp. NRRL F-5123 TaxID=1463856 RepID=UPI0004E139CD|nr:TROVE domain-containing protein [Streptomyces sp. NRRL F-5123]